MMVYLVTEADIARLLDKLQKDPRVAPSNVLSKEEERIRHDTYRRFNYHVRGWINEIKEPK